MQRTAPSGPSAFYWVCSSRNLIQAQEVLPRPEPPFKGKIERLAKDSTPDFPKGIEAIVVLTPTRC
jgi:hypothetical protein